MPIRDRLAALRKNQPPPPAQAPPAAPEASPPKPAPKAAEPKEFVQYACGHKVGVKWFNTTPCSSCRGKARKAKLAAKPPRPPRPLDDPQTNRLPQGSAFKVSYDAEKVEWTGTLTVPGVGEFAGAASGVFQLLRALDGQYREAASQAPPEAGATTAQ